MNEGVEASGATVEDAIDAALATLGATEDEVEIKILAEGGPRGILGRKVDQARVLVRLRDERTDEDFDEDADDETFEPEPELEAQADMAEEFLAGLLDAMDMDGDLSSRITRTHAEVEISGPDMGLLIGKRGATLDAIQELTRAAVQRRTVDRARVNLDIEGYRARQRALLERKARDAAARVRRTGKPFSFEPMSAYERKVVHDALARFGGVTTSSEGEEPERKVVVRLQEGSRPAGGPGAGARRSRPARRF